MESKRCEPQTLPIYMKSINFICSYRLSRILG